MERDLLDLRLSVIQKIVEIHKGIGKTKIQKITYFLQEAVKVPLNYPFRMHYYGPYSDSLDGVLSFANSLGYIEIEPDPLGFGYHVTPCSENELVQIHEHPVAYNVSHADNAIEILGNLDTSTLELYATIHFIVKIQNLSKAETLGTVRSLKPKFTPADIAAAYRKLQEAQLI